MLLAAVMAAYPASARDVVIEQSTYKDLNSLCTFGQACTSYLSTISGSGGINKSEPFSGNDINFSLNYGQGNQDKIFVYSNGLISIGAALAQTVQGPNALTSYGSNVLTGLYLPPAVLGVASDYPKLSNFQYATGIDTLNTEFGIKPEVLRIQYDASILLSGGGSYVAKVQVNFTKQSPDGDFVLLYGYGSNYEGPLNLPDGGVIGINLGQNQDLSSVESSRAALADPSDLSVFNYRFVNGAVGTVPEPATWAMIILGFGTVGASLRRKPAPSSTVTA